MNHNLRYERLLHSTDTSQLSLRWNNRFKAGDYNLSYADALTLYSKGLRTIANLWDTNSNSFKQINGLAEELDLPPQVANGLGNMIANLETHHRYYLELPSTTTSRKHGLCDTMQNDKKCPM